MSKEYEFFLNIVKDYIEGKNTNECSDVNWNFLFSQATKHQLLPIIFYQCKNYLPKDIYKKYYSSYIHNIQINIKRNLLLENIINKLQEKKIVFTLIKGPLIAAYYPVWQHRTMGDIDFVSQHRNEVHNVLTELGYENTLKADNAEWSYKKDVMKIELNDYLISASDETLYPQLEQFLNSYDEYINNYKIEDNFHFIYILAHLRKHLMKYGVGFRQFVDIALLTKNCDKLDFQWIEKKLKETKLFDFAKIVMQMNEIWFNVTSPYDKIEINKEEIENKTEYIFANGVFGFDNEDNRGQTIAAKRRVGNETSKTSNFIKKIFLSYDAMVTFDYCKFLRGRPYLLPAAWIKRMYYTLSHKGVDYSKQKISGFFVSEEYIKQKEEMFKSWGL